MTIGENIKKIRKNKGLLQKELGEKLGVTAATISAFENNKTNIKFSTARKVAEALGVTIEELVGDNWSFFTLKEFKRDQSYTEDEPISYILDNAPPELAEALDYDVARIAAYYEALDRDRAEDSARQYALEKLANTTIPLDYLKLSPKGEKEAAKRVRELTEIKEYQKESKDPD